MCSSRRLCSFCGEREGLYLLKNGKVSCEKHWSRCPAERERARSKSLEQFQDPEKKERHKESQQRRHLNETKEDKENYKKKIKKFWEEHPETREEQRRKIRKVWEDNEYRDYQSKIHKEWWKIDGNRERAVESSKITIEQIQHRYPTFCKEEELRYNPKKLPLKKIQVHCKYDKCPRSKESGGWFTPTGSQLYNRISAIELSNGSDTSYMYCSDECRSKCCLFYLQTDPFELSRYNRYAMKVIRETERTVRKNLHKIENIELRGKENGYDLDHRFSVYDGFKNGVDYKIIAHWRNLKIRTVKENRTKHRNSSITLKQLLEETTSAS